VGKPDRLPPQNLEAELSMLGSCMLDNSRLDDVVDILPTPEPLYRDAHRIVYGAILTLYGNGHEVDAVSVSEELTRIGKFAQVGGNDLLQKIFEATPHAAHAVYYAGIIQNKHRLRRCAEAATLVLESVYGNQETADEVLDFAQRSFIDIGDQGKASQVLTATELVNKAMTAIAERRAIGSEMVGIPTPFSELNRYTHGLQPGQMSIVAARPGNGKTALALAIGDHTAKRGETVLFISIEMNEVEVMNRLISANASVIGDKFQVPSRLSVRDMTEIYKFAKDFERYPFILDPNPKRTRMQIMATSRKVQRKHGLGLIIIDYLGLIHEQAQKGENKNDTVGRISGGIRELARDLNVPVLALHQLNRNIENREDPTPKLSDLRDSGSLEQDAHVVMFLSRAKGEVTPGEPVTTTLHIAKNRNGSIGKLDLTFEPIYTRFTSQAQQEEPARNGAAY
jgi:replicative DNA helicase